MAAPQPADPQIVEPLPEPARPWLDRCLTNQQAWLVPWNSPDRTPGYVHLVKEVNPTQAYRMDDNIDTKTLDHHGTGWGIICFGFVLPRLAEGVYLDPNSDNRELVAIKCLNKQVVEGQLRRGHPEDPYKEINRMRAIGDNIHVLGCIEALQNETHIYVIMPYCNQVSLRSSFPENQDMSEDQTRLRQARLVFQQIVQNLMYLRHHRICHRDLSPGNCMMYRGRVVFNDLARSFQLPPEGWNVNGTGSHGTIQFQPPEVYMNFPYNAYGCDLWAAVGILFMLWTGHVLYQIPEPEDLYYRYFIMARGISMEPWNELTEEVWPDILEAELVSEFCDQNPRPSFVEIKSSFLKLSPEAREIFANVLRLVSHERWGLDEVSGSRFLNPPI